MKTGSENCHKVQLNIVKEYIGEQEQKKISFFYFYMIYVELKGIFVHFNATAHRKVNCLLEIKYEIQRSQNTRQQERQ